MTEQEISLLKTVPSLILRYGMEGVEYQELIEILQRASKGLEAKRQQLKREKMRESKERNRIKSVKWADEQIDEAIEYIKSGKAEKDRREGIKQKLYPTRNLPVVSAFVMCSNENQTKRNRLYQREEELRGLGLEIVERSSAYGGIFLIPEKEKLKWQLSQQSW